MPVAVETLHDQLRPLAGPEGDFISLVERMGDAKYVLIGEASHGTHEFYRARAEITRLLIEYKGFKFVAAEADWPDAYRVSRYVRGRGHDQNANVALNDFQRFPAWMWRNRDVLEFVDWLREHNELIPDVALRVGFYGLDLYSLHASIEAVLNYLDKVDPNAASEARRRYSCFDHSIDDAQEYGYKTHFGMSESCEREVLQQLTDLRSRAAELMSQDGFVARDEYFFAEQNAQVVKNAERYYREMYSGRINTWNLRDTHMADTFDALLKHHGPNTKAVIWAHNSHLGDARATQMGDWGEVNVGQLIRERHPHDSFLIGFCTNEGTVTAASEWGGEAERKNVRPGLRDSYEEFFHQFSLSTGKKNYWFDLDDEDVRSELPFEKLQRAIGVIYMPETERQSHYFRARLTEQFDALIHFDRTRALEPLERTSLWDEGELPETYPFAV
jgi:erythromycin esterase-like protein